MAEEKACVHDGKSVLQIPHPITIYPIPMQAETITGHIWGRTDVCFLSLKV